MSDMNTIQSSNESIDAVVRSFANDLETFANSISQKVGEVDSSMGRLQNAWQGTLYDNFSDNMRAKQSQMRQTVANARRLKEKLDEVASEMAAMLEFLRMSGEDDL